jgi:hypothetical protein
MKRFAILAGLALAVGIGSAAMACEKGIYAAGEPTVTTPQQACATGNCGVLAPAFQLANPCTSSNQCYARPDPEPTVNTPQKPDAAAEPTFQVACGNRCGGGCCW